MSLIHFGSGHGVDGINVTSSSSRLLLLSLQVPVTGSNTMCAMRASVVASSSSMHHIVPHFSLLFNWQTLSNWLCLSHALYVWPYVGHIHGLSPDTAPPCWRLPQPLHAFCWGQISAMVLSCLWVGVVWATFWAKLCWWYADIHNPAMSETPDILFWSCIAISNALAWLIFCSRVFSNAAFTSMSTSRASLVIPWINWSLIYMWDRSWWQFRHIKSQSWTPDRSWTT